MNPLMFKQYKAKKKRPVDPNAPPRPTLLGHDKTMREMQQQLSQYQQKIDHDGNEIRRLNARINRLELTVNQLLSALKRR